MRAYPCMTRVRSCARSPEGAGGRGLRRTLVVFLRPPFLSRWCPGGCPGLIHRCRGHGPVGVPVSVSAVSRLWTDIVCRRDPPLVPQSESISVSSSLTVPCTQVKCSIQTADLGTLNVFALTLPSVVPRFASVIHVCACVCSLSCRVQRASAPFLPAPPLVAARRSRIERASRSPAGVRP